MSLARCLTALSLHLQALGTQIDGDFIRESSITSFSEGRFVKVPL
jgi:hypothetical protein